MKIRILNSFLFLLLFNFDINFAVDCKQQQQQQPQQPQSQQQQPQQSSVLLLEAISAIPAAVSIENLRPILFNFGIQNFVFTNWSTCTFAFDDIRTSATEISSPIVSSESSSSSSVSESDQKTTIKTTTSGERNARGKIACALPANISTIFAQNFNLTGKTSITASLSVNGSLRNGTNFATAAAIKIQFFNCSKFGNCTACAASRFACVWCIGSHRCAASQESHVAHLENENCIHNDTIVPGVATIGPHARKGAEFCPRVHSAILAPSAGWSPLASSDESNVTEILIPNETTKRIALKLVNIPAIFRDANFFCQFGDEINEMADTNRTTGAKLSGDGSTLECNSFHFAYPQNRFNTHNLVVYQRLPNGRTLHYPANIRIKVYKCARMAYDCPLCLEAINEKYECVWCTASARCDVAQNCENPRSNATTGTITGVAESGVNWLNATQGCPA